jgi:chromosome segregation ATPase
MLSSTLSDTSKNELQTMLKDKYKINKNISGDLTADECRQLVSMLSQGNIGLEKLLAAYADKNGSLSKNNAFYGRQRSSSEKKAVQLQQECEELQATISRLGDKKTTLSSEYQQLVQQIETLEGQKFQLSSKVQQLDSSNHELTKVNHELKQDNKRLKNLVDAIRLNLSKSVKGILRSDDSEIKRALAKFYKSLLG